MSNRSRARLNLKALLPGPEAHLAPPSPHYRKLESSHNLEQWKVETNLVATSSTESTRIGSPENETPRFYRAVTR